MRLFRLTTVAGLAACSLAANASGVRAAPWPAPYTRPATYQVVSQTAVPVRMADGTVLRANIYRPDAPGRFPVLLFQTPYGSNGAQHNDGGASDPYLVQRGYVQIAVDVRGTGQSQGTWNPFQAAEQRDGYALVEWAARQPWSNGRVGGAGGSYLAIDQLLTAALRPPHLKAIFPFAPLGDAYRDMVMTGGSADTAFIPAWIANVTAGMVQAPVNDGSGSADVISHVHGVDTAAGELVVGPLSGNDLAYDGGFWGDRSPLEVVDRIRVPTFVVGGLHDIFQRGEPLLYERLKRHVPARLLIGPWMHLNYFNNLPADGVPVLHELELRWYDHWLKKLDTRIGEIPKVTQYQWGRAHFVTSSDWPNPRLRIQRLYLRGQHALASQPPVAEESPQSFQQNPATGICTLSTSQWTAGAGGYLPCEDRTEVDGVLGDATYETAPQTRSTTIDGPIMADIWMTTTAQEAPLTVRVFDVAADGSTHELTDGWLSASLRRTEARRSRIVRGTMLQPWHPFTASSALPVATGKPMRMRVEVFPTNALIAAGHRLRVELSAGDFPHQLQPAPATGRALVGTTTILTDPAHPSSIVLPTVGASCTRGRARHRRGCRPLPLPSLIRGTSSMP